MPGANGTTANDSSTVIIDHGRREDEHGLSAKGGIQSSLKKILIMSATTCSSPNGPTRFGPVAVLPQRQQPPLQPDQPGRQRQCGGQHTDN